MARSTGYWVDLQGPSVKFNEDGTCWIHGAPLGTYHHPIYGEVNITPEKVKSMADGVKNKIRGVDIDIDYDHKRFGGEAAGWVRNADARADGLWLLVEWTTKAFQLIKEKAYRYFSPEMADEWEHPSTKVKYKDVLFGGGLTNRPFLKDILPINMSELYVEPQKEATGMDPKELRKKLGLAEDATDEQVDAKLTELTGPPEKEKEKEKVDDKSTSSKDDKDKDKDEKLTDEDIDELLNSPDLVALAEKSPAIKKLTEVMQGQQAKITVLESSVKLSEVDAQVAAIMAPKDGKVIPESQRETVRKALAESPTKQFSDDVLKPMFENLRTVELGEIGSTHTGSGGGVGADAAAIKRFNEKVAEVMKGNDKLSYADASIHVASTDPQLYSDYQDASYAFRV